MYSRRSQDKACVPREREAAPVAVVTAVDCGSRRAWVWPPLTSEVWNLLLPPPTAAITCLLGWCRGSPEAPCLRMIETDVEQRWPQGHVSTQVTFMLGSKQNLWAVWRGPNLNRPIPDVSFAVHTGTKKIRCKSNSHDLQRDVAPEAALQRRPWEHPARLNSEL